MNCQKIMPAPPPPKKKVAVRVVLGSNEQFLSVIQIAATYPLDLKRAAGCQMHSTMLGNNEPPISEGV